MTPHSSILAWRIPWTEEHGELQSIGSQRVGHDWATEHLVLNYTHLTQIFLIFLYCAWVYKKHSDVLYLIRLGNSVVYPTYLNFMQSFGVSLFPQCKSSLFRKFIQILSILESNKIPWWTATSSEIMHKPIPIILCYGIANVKKYYVFKLIFPLY